MANVQSLGRRFNLSPLAMPIALSAAIAILGTRHDDQVALIFDHLSIVDFIALAVITMWAGISLQALARARVTPWPVDGLLFAAPVLSLTGVWIARGFWIAAAIGMLGIVVQHTTSRYIDERSSPSRAVLTAVIGAIAVWLVCVAATRLSPVIFPRAVGSASLSFLFLSLLAIAIQTVFRFPRILTPVFLVLCLVFIFHEQEHRIDVTQFEMIDADDESQYRIIRSQVSLQQTFQNWLVSRNDLDEYKRRKIPYPVFLVASQGGGGYAAAHSDLFLSKLQATCPNFAQHLFAAVGVSGGAVGNAMFVADLSDKTNFSSFQGCTAKMADDRLLERLSSDHLSPILGSLYFNDFPNKVLFGVLGGSDRSAALRASIIQALGGAESDVDPLSWDQYWQSSPPSNDWRLGTKPALIPVATNATSGRRYVFAPFAFSFPNGRFEEALLDMNNVGMHNNYHSSDVRALDAAIASASFPYVTPSRQLGGVSLVDGGYIENDGAETARDILAELQSPNPDFDGASILGMELPSSYSKANGVQSCAEIYLKYVPVNVKGDSTVEYSDDANENMCTILFSVHAISIRAEVPSVLQARAQNFFSDPIVSLLSARSRRGETARFALLSQLCGEYNCAPQVEDAVGWRLYESVIRTDELTLPLGWYLPTERIKALSDCVAPNPSEEFNLNETPNEGGMAAIIEWQSRKFSTMGGNPYIMQAILEALNPDGISPIDYSRRTPSRCSTKALGETVTESP